MIHAYDKVYLDEARMVLGRMLDFAVYDLKYDIEDFFSLFITSGIAARFEKGDYSVIVGMSGVELAEQSGVPLRTIQQYEQRQKRINKAQAEYLLMLAHAQWQHKSSENRRV